MSNKKSNYKEKTTANGSRQTVSGLNNDRKNFLEL